MTVQANKKPRAPPVRRTIVKVETAPNKENKVETTSSKTNSTSSSVSTGTTSGVVIANGTRRRSQQQQQQQQQQSNNDASFPEAENSASDDNIIDLKDIYLSEMKRAEQSIDSKVLGDHSYYEHKKEDKQNNHSQSSTKKDSTLRSDDPMRNEKVKNFIFEFFHASPAFRAIYRKRTRGRCPSWLYLYAYTDIHVTCELHNTKKNMCISRSCCT